MTGKYGIPYFSNFVNSDMKPEDARSMCCRLRLDNRELRSRGGGLFGSNPLTGSIGVVTVNLPRIAYLSSDLESFRHRLGAVMETARESLELKRKIIEELTDRGLYPYTRHYLGEIKRETGNYWANHFSTIGLIGMNEACVNFMGKGIRDPEARDWAIDVLEFMREKLSEFQNGASYRLASRDSSRFPGAQTMGSSNPFYTNSVHLPVSERMDIYDLLDHQDPLQTRFTGGTVVHIFLGESINDWKMVRKLTRSIVSRFHLPYFSFTPTFSICPVHGYVKGEHFLCPYPHSDTELDRFGEVVEYTGGLPEGSFRTVDAAGEDSDQGSLFLQIGKVSL
jgi:ribonucleoside-triphosphate reductase